jgi:hypothetical protein
MSATLCDCGCSVGFGIVQDCGMDSYDAPMAGRSARKPSSMGRKEMLRGTMTGSSEAACMELRRFVDPLGTLSSRFFHARFLQSSPRLSVMAVAAQWCLNLGFKG